MLIINFKFIQVQLNLCIKTFNTIPNIYVYIYIYFYVPYLLLHTPPSNRHTFVLSVNTSHSFLLCSLAFSATYTISFSIQLLCSHTNIISIIILGLLFFFVFPSSWFPSSSSGFFYLYFALSIRFWTHLLVYRATPTSIPPTGPIMLS
jgi:hypothetical protein